MDINEGDYRMAKAYIMALVKFTDKDKFMADYGSKVADVFKPFGGHFWCERPLECIMKGAHSTFM